MMVVVMFKHGVAEVIGEVAVHAVNVIGVILSVVVLDEERRALNEVVVRLAGIVTVHG
mgnify:CR=1 FL=1